MGREDPQLKLRLSEEMKQRVTDSARANNRSVNAEIVTRLERTFAEDDHYEELATAQPEPPIPDDDGDKARLRRTELPDGLDFDEYQRLLSRALREATRAAFETVDKQVLARGGKVLVLDEPDDN